MASSKPGDKDQGQARVSFNGSELARWQLGIEHFAGAFGAAYR